MKYDECTCFWCGKSVENQIACFSLKTDTMQTRRNFCNEEHLLSFKRYMLEQQEKKKPILPYKGM